MLPLEGCYAVLDYEGMTELILLSARPPVPLLWYLYFMHTDLLPGHATATYYTYQCPHSGAMLHYTLSSLLGCTGLFAGRQTLLGRVQQSHQQVQDSRIFYTLRTRQP